MASEGASPDWRGAGVVMALGVAIVAGLTLLVSPRQRDRPEAIGVASPLAVLPGDDSASVEEVARLERKLRALEARLEEQQASRRNGLAPDAAVAEGETPTLLSDSEMSARMTTFYDAQLLSGLNARNAAFESEVSTFLAESAVPGCTVSKIECGDKLCKVVVAHSTPRAREELTNLWGRGPFRYGSFDYLADDGLSTVAFIGQPGLPLPMPTLD